MNYDQDLPNAEEARAELARRGASLPSPIEAREELERRGISQTNLLKPKPPEEEAYEPKGWGGVARDVVESGISAPGAGLKGLMNFPEHVSSAAKYGREHPLGGLGQLAMGLPEGAAGLASLPQVGLRYATDKFGPESVSKALKATPTPYEFLRGIEAQHGMAPTEPGQEEIRTVGQLFVPGGPLAKLMQFTGEGGDPIHMILGGLVGKKALSSIPKAPDFLRNTKDRRNAGEKLAEAEEELAAHESDLKTAQARAKSTSPEAMDVKAENIEQEIADLQNNLKNRKPESSGVVTDPKQMIPDLSHQENVERSSNLLNDSQQFLDEVHENQALQLGRGQNFSERAAPLITQGVESVKTSIRPLYDSVDRDLRGQNVTIPNEGRLAAIQQHMNTLRNQGLIAPQNDAVYDRILNQLIEQWPGEDYQTIPAADYVNTYKLTRDLSRIAENRSHQEGITQPERQRWREQANIYTPLAAEQRGILQRSIPEQTFNNLNEADRKWATEVIPFYNSKVYRDAQGYKGKTSKNIIEDASGVSPSSRAMQHLIQSIPELNRLALGQQYAHRPHELLNYNEMTQPYVEAHHPTQRHLTLQRRAITANNNIQNAHNTIQQRGTDIDNAQTEHYNKLKAAEDQRTKEKQTEQKEIDKIKKTLKDKEAEYKKNRKDKAELQAVIKKHGLTKERVEKLKKYDDQAKKIKDSLWDFVISTAGNIMGQNVFGAIFKILMK
jgi:hypothetical protein